MLTDCRHSPNCLLKHKRNVLLCGVRAQPVRTHLVIILTTAYRILIIFSFRFYTSSMRLSVQTNRNRETTICIYTTFNATHKRQSKNGSQIVYLVRFMAVVALRACILFIAFFTLIMIIYNSNK